MKKFRINNWKIQIEEREIVKETDKTVFFLTSSGREDREAKISGYARWFDIRQEAIDFMRVRVENNIKNLRANIEKQEKELQEIAAL